MLAIVGVVLVIGMVFGGYMLAGGKFGIILKALPFELMMIGGAAAGTFLIANKPDVVKGALGDIRRVVSGPQWRKDDYRDLLSLDVPGRQAAEDQGRAGARAAHRQPARQRPVRQVPRRSRRTISRSSSSTDTLRMMTMSMDDPYQVEECMQRQLRKHHAELHARAAALQSIADATPALGIVAAVLGVVKTMASINQPVEVLGEMIGGALVGTFLGVFLAYGFIGPIAAKMNQTYERGCPVLRHHPRLPGRLSAGPLGADRGRAGPRQRADHAAAELPCDGRGARARCRPIRWRPDRMAREPRPIVIRRPIVSRRPWRITAGPGRSPMPTSSPR